MKSTNFFDYYNSLPNRKAQKQLRHKIISLCGINKVTFYDWLKRREVPHSKNREIIADILETPIGVLFPESIIKEA